MVRLHVGFSIARKRSKACLRTEEEMREREVREWCGEVRLRRKERDDLGYLCKGFGRLIINQKKPMAQI